jgi:hypothetical protein
MSIQYQFLNNTGLARYHAGVKTLIDNVDLSDRVAKGTGTGAVKEGNIQSNTSSGTYSHTEGNGTAATGKSQHVFGEYNIAENVANGGTRGTYVEIVGNGNGIANDTKQYSNARTLDWNGNETLAGNLTLGGSLTINGVTLDATILSKLIALTNHFEEADDVV